MMLHIALGVVGAILVYESETCDILSGNGVFGTRLPTVHLKEPYASYKMATALKEWGFSYVTGHDIPEHVIRKANQQSRIFFGLPRREKRQIQSDRGKATKTVRGYSALRTEQLDLSKKGKPDLKEVFDVGFTTTARPNHYLGANKWPKRGKRGLKNAVDSYASYASDVAQTVLNLTAKGLGCENEFNSMFGPDALQVQRLTRYPPSHEIVSKEPGQIGAGVHSDYGGITVLYAEGPGLSVLKPIRNSRNVEKGTFSSELGVPNSGNWVEVESVEDAFIVMAGEALQRLSNGQIYAAKHKVEFSGTMPRYSLAFFYDPNPEAILEPLMCFRKNSFPMYKSKIAGHKGQIRKSS